MRAAEAAVDAAEAAAAAAGAGPRNVIMFLHLHKCAFGQQPSPHHHILYYTIQFIPYYSCYTIYITLYLSDAGA